MYLGRASASPPRFIESFWKSRDIEQIYKQAQALRNSPISQMFVAGYTELAKLQSDEQLKDDREGNLANIERALRRAQTVETTKLESMVPFLATTGSAAPFIGLFGTVMGILFAFLDIADPNDPTRRPPATLDVGRPAHRRGAVRDRDRPGRRDPGGHGLQLLHAPDQACSARRWRRSSRTTSTSSSATS